MTAAGTPRTGDEIELVYTSDEHTTLRPGDRGIVTLVDDCGTIHAKWANGSRLGLIPGTDFYKVVDRQERPAGRCDVHGGRSLAACDHERGTR